jgi:hypothetical protein
VTTEPERLPDGTLAPTEWLLNETGEMEDNWYELNFPYQPQAMMSLRPFTRKMRRRQLIFDLIHGGLMHRISVAIWRLKGRP